MPARTSWTTKGFESYLENLARIGTDVDEAAAEALLAGAEILQEAIQAETPVRDPKVKAKEPVGNLRAHIKIKGPDQDGNYHVVEVGIIHDKRFTDANTARYGNAQNFGWLGHPGKHFIEIGTSRGRAAARREMENVFKRRSGIE